MEMKDNLIICSTELSSPKGKIPLFPHLLVEFLKKNGAKYTVISLVHIGGDYVVQSAKVVIERKTMADFIHTWLHGSKKGKERLEDQLEKALGTYPDAMVILAIEDYYRCRLDYEANCVWIPTYEYKKGQKIQTVGYYKIAVNPRSIKGKLRALKKRIKRAQNDPNDKFNRVKIKKFYGAQHMLQWFLEIIEPTSPQTKKETLKVNRIKRKNEDITDQRLFFLEGLPHIGPKTSQALLDNFETPMNALLNIGKWKKKLEGVRITNPMIEDGAKVLGMEVEKEE